MSGEQREQTLSAMGSLILARQQLDEAILELLDVPWCDRVTNRLTGLAKALNETHQELGRILEREASHAG